MRSLLVCVLFFIILHIRCNGFTPTDHIASKESFWRLQESRSSIDRRKSPALWRLADYHQDRPRRRRRRSKSKPLVMSPAGGWPQLRAAVGNGADAVYVGLTAFSARARATNFDQDEELVAAVTYCHQHGVELYVALNTLVMDGELEEVATLVEACERAGVDALIVQDVGVARNIVVQHSRVPLHASTQQSVTDGAGVEFCVKTLGASRVVVGRELSVAEVAALDTDDDTEIEVFVHGALCVSYSGQCFSSEAWGGRSANRGQCAQACRLPYGLVVNGELQNEMKDLQYVLSPQDLCGLDHVSALIDAGVSCLKIEGRLKDATYVAATTRAYRNAVDRAWQDLTGEPPIDMKHVEVSKRELQQLFSRGQDEVYAGLSPGFLNGTMHQHVVRGRSPRHRGLHVGRVVRGSNPARGIEIEVTEDLKLGDGICIDRGAPELQELGGSIYSIHSVGPDQLLIQLSQLDMQKFKSNPDLVPTGAHVWKTHDTTVEKKFKRLSEVSPPKPKRLVRVRVCGSIGHPLQVIISYEGTEYIGATESGLEQARGQGLTADAVQKAIGTLGNTDFSIKGTVDVASLDSNVWCPVSKIKEARRQAVDELLHNTETAAQPPTTTTKDFNIRKRVAESIQQRRGLQRRPPKTDPKLSVLCRDEIQVKAVCDLLRRESLVSEVVDEIMIDFLELEGIQDAISLIRKSQGVKVVVASPRILKPGEEGMWKSLLALEPDGLLVRSTGLIHELMQLGGTGAVASVGTLQESKSVTIPVLLGDFSLNVANSLTAAEFLSFGLSRVTASYDLNANTIKEMGSLLGDAAKSLEVVAHCKIPVFHTEHCVFARFLTKGNSYMDCGHACTRNKVHLRDNMSGHDNLVLADMGCRNTVFGAQAQSGIHSLDRWRSAGMERFRIELVDESAADAQTILKTYTDVLNGKIHTSKAWAELDTMRDSNGRRTGVTLGSFKNTQERRAGEL